METKPVNVAVVTGGHAFDVINFHKLFLNMDNVNGYIQHLDDFATSSQVVRESYDVLLFYIMMMQGPTDDGLPEHCGRPKTVLEQVGHTKQGIVVLHHGLLAYPQWPIWNEIVGIQDRTLAGYSHDETLQLHLADRTHPITQGFSDWTMVDETYDMADASAGNHILLTVEHPDSMKTIAWTRSYQNSSVFCCQLGHDYQAWQHPNFVEILKRGILWSCGRLV